jgi:hypothetical protein
VQITPRRRAKPVCSGCGKKGPGYDTLSPPRLFAFVPLWGLLVYLVYSMRRVDCGRCGVTVEMVPWATGKSQTTYAMMWFLASWAKVLSWAEVARRFYTSWDTVFRCVQHAVRWGLEHRSLDGIRSIGVDELAWKKGHKYLTLVYQIDHGCRRLLWIGRDRTQQTFNAFFDMLGEARSKSIRFIASDMWKAFLSVVKRRASGAVHVLDRFHVVQLLNKAIDEVRRDEMRTLRKNGTPATLSNTRWILLKKSQQSDVETAHPPAGPAANQPSHGSRLPAEGALPALLEVRLGQMGRAVPRRLDAHGDALPNQAAPEVREDAPRSPRPSTQLVPCPRGFREGRRRGFQQQSENHDQKSLRVSDLRARRDRPLPRARRPAGASLAHPQILLRRPPGFFAHRSAKDPGRI